MEKILLLNSQSPGDTIMLTAAVRDLKRAYPFDYEIHVKTSNMELWVNNPNVVMEIVGAPDPKMRVVTCHYPTINQSNRLPRHFVEAFHRYLELSLCRPSIPVTEFRGDIYLTDDERNQYPLHHCSGEPLRYWLVISGGKHDYTAKWPVKEHLNEALKMIWDGLGQPKNLRFVQIGMLNHHQPQLAGEYVKNLVGLTTLRNIIHFVYHCEGCICPVTFLPHLAAAVPSKAPPFPIPEKFSPNAPENILVQPPLRPCVVMAGGREPRHWESYPGHQFLDSIGTMDCCAGNACWRSRAQRVNDGDAKDREHRCLHPKEIGDIVYAGCIADITPRTIADAVLRYYTGGALKPFTN